MGSRSNYVPAAPSRRGGRPLKFVVFCRFCGLVSTQASARRWVQAFSTIEEVVRRAAQPSVQLDRLHHPMGWGATAGDAGVAFGLAKAILEGCRATNVRIGIAIDEGPVETVNGVVPGETASASKAIDRAARLADLQDAEQSILVTVESEEAVRLVSEAADVRWSDKSMTAPLKHGREAQYWTLTPTPEIAAQEWTHAPIPGRYAVQPRHAVVFDLVASSHGDLDSKVRRFQELAEGTQRAARFLYERNGGGDVCWQQWGDGGMVVLPGDGSSDAWQFASELRDQVGDELGLRIGVATGYGVMYQPCRKAGRMMAMGPVVLQADGACQNAFRDRICVTQRFWEGLRHDEIEAEPQEDLSQPELLHVFRPDECYPNFVKALEVYREHLKQEIEKDHDEAEFFEVRFDELNPRLEVWPETEWALGQEPRSVSLRELVHCPRSAIVGEPGSGKTTTIRKWATQLLDDEDLRGLKVIPVPVKLAALATCGGMGAVQFIREHRLRQLELPEDLRDEFGKERQDMTKEHQDVRFYVLLDGWDQVGDSFADERIVPWLRELSKCHHWVVTSRHESADSLPDCDRYVPPTPTDGEIRNFIKDRIPEAVDELTRHVRTSAELGMLATTPLGLLMICVAVDRQLEQGPQKAVESVCAKTKAEIYHDGMDAFLDRHADTNSMTERERDLVRQALGRLAYDVSGKEDVRSGEEQGQDRGGLVFERQDILQAAQKAVRACEKGGQVSIVDRVAELVYSKDGLVCQHANGAYEFVYPWFREILAAECLRTLAEERGMQEANRFLWAELSGRSAFHSVNIR